MTENLRKYLEGEIDAEEYLRRADAVYGEDDDA
jgi:hypothetical protein